MQLFRSPPKQPTAEDVSLAEEFAKRDEMGLDKNSKPKTEEEQRAFYYSMIGKAIFLQAPFLGWLAYFAVRLVPGQAERIDAKFDLIATYDLGWVFVTTLLALLTKSYLMINVNGARAAARVDRPDQHVYKIMSAEKYKDAPYVLMASTGPAGRFNRAQRASLNHDETLPVFLVNLVLVACVYGPLAVVIAATNLYARKKFADAYKADLSQRGAGFFLSAITEFVTVGMIWVTVMKAFFPMLP